MKRMWCAWKPNWAEAKTHFIDWWNREGLVFAMWGAPPADPPHEDVPDPGPPVNPEQKYADPFWRARRNHYDKAHETFLFDNPPIANTMVGPGSLALSLGSEPGFSEDTVWFHPTMQSVEKPEDLPPLAFDPDSHWWQVQEQIIRKCVTLADGKYMVGCPDLVENIDILAALRDPQHLMMDMIERPAWVMNKVREINQVFFEAYDRIYDMIKLPDGSSAFVAFGLWGPGKTAKVQCDASAMFSPDMFKQFVVPALSEQCEWLDYSMYHLDGTQCICHLDHLLQIDALDAIEWTPQAGIEGGGSPRWYDLYRRILAAGKSVQAVGVEADEVMPLLDAVGGKGMHIISHAIPDGRMEVVMERLAEYQ